MSKENAKYVLKPILNLFLSGLLLFAIISLSIFLVLHTFLLHPVWGVLVLIYILVSMIVASVTDLSIFVHESEIDREDDK